MDADHAVVGASRDAGPCQRVHRPGRLAVRIQHHPTKSFSWLEWPVKLKGLAESFNPHITCKFFGTAMLDAHFVASKVVAHYKWSASDFAWETKIWNGHDEKPYFVLALTKYPEPMAFAHAQFGLIKDQFRPWIPHITVPKSYFFLVEDQRFTPENCELEVGEITLCLGGENV